MRTIDGVVIRGGRIRLRGGTVVPCPHPIRLGTNVKVGYNFTSMGVNFVEEADKCLMEEEEPEEEEEIPDDLDHDAIDEICRFENIEEIL